MYMNYRKYELSERIWLGVVIFCLVLMAVLFVYNRSENRKKVEMLQEEQRERVSEAENEELLREELEKLEKNYREETKGVATGEWVVTQLNEAVYTDMYPVTKRFDAEIVLGLSEEEFPGNDGKITRGQFAELVGNGWSYLFVYDGEKDLGEWIETMKEKMRSIGFKSPGTIYFEYEKYKPEYDEALLQAGFETVVHHGENDLPMTGLEIEENGLWKVGSVNWNGDGVDEVLDALAAGGYNMAFTVDFGKEESKFTEAGFEEMLEYIAPNRESGKLNVTGFSEARDAVKKRWEDNSEKRAEFEKRKSEIEKQLREEY